MTWNGYPASDDGSMPDGSRSTMAVLGVCSDIGASGPGGQREGPAAIRNAGSWVWADMYSHATRTTASCAVADCGDVSMVGGRLDATGNVVTSDCDLIVPNTGLLCVLGGDNSVSRYVLRSIAKPHGPVVVVVFDAHVDMWQPYPGDLDGPNHATWLADGVEDRTIKHAHVYGNRTPGPEQSVYRKFRKRITAHGMGPVPVPPKEPFYLAVDIDVVDPAFAPGTGYPEPGGWTSARLLHEVRRMASSQHCVGMDITEVCPPRDSNGITSLLASRVLLEVLLGRSARET